MSSISKQSRAQLTLIGLLFVAVLIVGISTSTEQKPFNSKEAKFTDRSQHGLSIVPASCPSYPHYSGECDPPPQPPPPVPPIVVIPHTVDPKKGTITDNSSSTPLTNGELVVLEGETITLSWQCTNSTVSSSNFATIGSTSGSVDVTTNDDTDYYYVCSNPNGDSSVTLPVTTLKPRFDLFQVHPQLVRRGDYTHLTWNAKFVRYCTITAPDGFSWTTSSAVGDVQSNPVTGQTTFNATCYGLVSQVQAQDTVNIIPQFNER